MKKLYYKVLEIKEQCDHTIDDIDDIVKSRIEKLNEDYNTRHDRNKTQGKYISKEYKAFVIYTGKDEDKYNNLLEECIIRTTNIANFIDGKTKRPQNVTKDFFAVYCECEGYNDFVIKYKSIDVHINTGEEFPQETKTKKEFVIQDSAELNLKFIVEHPASRSETLVDAFDLGLHNYFINYFEDYDKRISDKKFSSENTFPILFESLNLDVVFSFDTFDFILKRLKINKQDLSKETLFDDNEKQFMFNIGNMIAARIFNRIAVEIYSDSEHLYGRRVEIDSNILNILTWLDLENIYLNTIENYDSIEPDRILKFISELKGTIREKFTDKVLYREQMGDFLAKLYLFGFESKIDEVLSYKARYEYVEVDTFLSEIQEGHSRDNILYFTKVENTNDLDAIKLKINSSSLKDYFMIGELIAQDLIACLVFTTKTIYETETAFIEDMSLRKINEIENLLRSLNLMDIYNSYMPKLYYKDKRCKLDGNYNIFIMKVLKRINTLDIN